MPYVQLKLTEKQASIINNHLKELFLACLEVSDAAPMHVVASSVFAMRLAEIMRGAAASKVKNGLAKEEALIPYLKDVTNETIQTFVGSFNYAMTDGNFTLQFMDGKGLHQYKFTEGDFNG